ncbi:nacrein-like protein P1, partial [Biomphalaria glabrata]
MGEFLALLPPLSVYKTCWDQSDHLPALITSIKQLNLTVSSLPIPLAIMKSAVVLCLLIAVSAAW